MSKNNYLWTAENVDSSCFENGVQNKWHLKYLHLNALYMIVLFFFLFSWGLNSPFKKILANCCTKMVFSTITFKNLFPVELQYKIMENCPWTGSIWTLSLRHIHHLFSCLQCSEPVVLEPSIRTCCISSSFICCRPHFVCEETTDEIASKERKNEIVS